jgi:hypothetical protein
MSDLPLSIGGVRKQLDAALSEPDDTSPASERLIVSSYPEDRDDGETEDIDAEVASLVEAAREQAQQVPTPQGSGPIGYVTNARNAASRSDAFVFWSPAEEISLGVGSLVRHSAPDPTGKPTPIETYGIVTSTDGLTLGLDDFAPHAYEQDCRPPLTSIQPSPSRRRPVVNYKAQVLASTHSVQRPVLTGPVFPLAAGELPAVHGKPDAAMWPIPAYMLLGFYEDILGNYGVLAEERARVLGPKQGHVILSGQPGAGKTSLYQTVLIALYAQLQSLEGEQDSDEA